MRKIVILIIISIIAQATWSQDNLIERDLSKYVLWWQGNGVDVTTSKGMLFPQIKRNYKAREYYGSAFLDLTQLNLQDNLALYVGLTENSCLISSPKRKNGVGHLAIFGITVLYENLKDVEESSSVMFKYNYFEHKNKNWCDAYYSLAVGDWQYLGWNGRELIIEIKKNGATLSTNAGVISNSVKKIKGITVYVDKGADITISKFSIKEESNAYKAWQLYTDAMIKYEQQDFPTCIDLTTRIIEEFDDKNADAYKTRGNACANLGYFKMAISDLEKALLYASSIPESPQKKKAIEEIYTMLGWCKLSLKDMKGAYESLLKGGFQGQIIINEYNVESQLSTNIIETKDVSEAIFSEIEISSNNSKFTSKDIFSKYNNAVFMVLTTNNDGTAQGSGFFIGKNGLAISNYHVFEGAIRGKEQVKLMNGGTYQVKEILGYDKEKDFIIFRVEGNGFSYIPITKRGYEIGDEVYAIGSPKGMQNTLSNGLISQKWDDTKFQISVPIDHGSSGGALINQYGEVIGITSGGRDDTHANLNYAVDIRTIFNQNE
ncbi:MAG: serine protease, partial [Paramuribaculum sp.]